MLCSVILLGRYAVYRIFLWLEICQIGLTVICMILFVCYPCAHDCLFGGWVEAVSCFVRLRPTYPRRSRQAVGPYEVVQLCRRPDERSRQAVGPQEAVQSCRRLESGPDRLQARRRRSSNAEVSLCMLFCICIDMIFALVSMGWYFGCNSLSLRAYILSFIVSGIFDERGKAKA